MFESIAAAFYNIGSFQEQILITQKNVASADTLLQIVTNKLAQGLIKQQDVNDAIINKLTLEDKLKQITRSLVL